jgi:hypothetical protein
MSSHLRRTALSGALFLLALPLALAKPGWPPALKADEPAYLMMAQSLARDLDLRLEPADLERLFREFPYGPVSNLIVMTDDGWHTVYYGKPYVYSLLASPLVLFFGANGLLLLNVLLTLGMVALGARYLARFNPPGVGLLFSTGFFVVSAGFSYVFWLQPEVLNMAAVTACLYLGLVVAPEGSGRRAVVAAALSGAVLSPAVYNKPMLVALGLAALVAALRRRQWCHAGLWLGGLLLALGLLAGGAALLTGHPTPYLGVRRQGVTLCSPDRMPIAPLPPAEAQAADPERPTGGAWTWLFRVPETSVPELSEGLGYFLLGRHTGLFLYFPFALMALSSFLVAGRRPEGWALLASLAAVALFFVVFIPQNWQGGGGFIGNRYFVNAVPAFLFLATELRPRILTPLGFALGGLLLSPLLLSPFSRTGPEPTLQSHVRNFPYPLFPLELSLKEVPGYYDLRLGDYRLRGRRDQVLPRGDQVWIRGAGRAELWITGLEPLERPVVVVESPVAGQRVRLRLGETRAELGFPEGQPPVVRLELEAGEPDRVRRHFGTEVYAYRLVVEPETGRVRTWTRPYPPPPCTEFAFNESIEESFYLGAALTFLGEARELAAEVFGARWEEARVPPRVTAGAGFVVPVTLVNTSSARWPVRGAVRVAAAYHWLDEVGRVVVLDGPRTPLPGPVAPGEEVPLVVTVEAPAEPGRYQLELDLVFEHVAWFGQRGVETYRAPVEVAVAPVDPEPGDGGP